jgi:hypothetical protein
MSKAKVSIIKKIASPKKVVITPRKKINSLLRGIEKEADNLRGIGRAHRLIGNEQQCHTFHTQARRITERVQAVRSLTAIALDE